MNKPDKITSFGFKDVSWKEKDTLVKRVFSDVAEHYDLMNDLMSGGIHRFWKDFMVSQIRPLNKMNTLDVAAGTGDITFRIAQKFPDASLTLCDINPEMIEVGKKRATQKCLLDQITWVCGNASDLPFKENTFDTYTIAFGLRNVTDIPAALSEAHRTLKPGGQFLCLEFSEVVLPFFKEAYKKYSFQVIPRMGQLFAHNEGAYQYLVESIARFPNQKKLEKMLEEADFEHVTHTNLAGGIAALHMGWKI